MNENVFQQNAQKLLLSTLHVRDAVSNAFAAHFLCNLFLCFNYFALEFLVFIYPKGSCDGYDEGFFY